MQSPLEVEQIAPPEATPPSAEPIEAPARKKSGPAPRRGNAPSAELQELKDRYLLWMTATQYAPDTIKGAHCDVEWLYRYLGMRGVLRIGDVTPEVLNDYSLWMRELRHQYHHDRKLSVHHLSHRLIGVKWFFKWLAQNMIVLCDPSEDLELPRIVRTLPQTILTQAEARRLLNAQDLRSPVGYRDKALLELVYATGIRSGELFKLKISDVDIKAGTLAIHQGKGGKDRIIPLPPLTMGYLKEYVEKVRPRLGRYGKYKEQGYLFVTYTGTPVASGQLKEIMQRNAKAARLDKPVTAMILRHSIATHLLENGMNMRYIQEFLGHEDMRTTQIYAKVSLAGLRKHYNKHHPREKRVRGRVQEVGHD